jgi:hypothetical protein
MDQCRTDTGAGKPAFLQEGQLRPIDRRIPAASDVASGGARSGQTVERSTSRVGCSFSERGPEQTIRGWRLAIREKKPPGWPAMDRGLPRGKDLEHGRGFGQRSERAMQARICSAASATNR